MPNHGREFWQGMIHENLFRADMPNQPATPVCTNVVESYKPIDKLTVLALDNAIVDAQLIRDRYIFGNSYHTIDVAGRKTRIDPTTVRIDSGADGKAVYVIIGENGNLIPTELTKQ